MAQIIVDPATLDSVTDKVVVLAGKSAPAWQVPAVGFTISSSRWRSRYWRSDCVQAIPVRRSRLLRGLGRNKRLKARGRASGKFLLKIKVQRYVHESQRPGLPVSPLAVRCGLQQARSDRYGNLLCRRDGAHGLLGA